MADPKNPGYKLTVEATGDPDVIRVVETDDVDGDAPARNVSAVEAGRLVAAADVKPVKKAVKKK